MENSALLQGSKMHLNSCTYWLTCRISHELCNKIPYHNVICEGNAIANLCIGAVSEFHLY